MLKSAGVNFGKDSGVVLILWSISERNTAQLSSQYIYSLPLPKLGEMLPGIFQ